MSRPPNIVIVTSHDTGRHLGCYGVGTVSTPALDRLAAEGCRFDGYFAASPVCSPSRGAAMTGRWPQSNGLMGLVHTPWLWELKPDERHLAAIMRDAGYQSLLFNVQHESKDWQRLGFEQRFDCRRRQEGRVTAMDTALAFRDFLGERARTAAGAGRPLYAQVGFFETHTPYAFSGSEPDAGRGVHVPGYLVDNEAARSHLAGLQGAVRDLDRAVEVILAAVDEAGMRENTLVIYTTDHGIEAARDKWECHDPGIGIALMMRWPAGGIAGGRVNGQLLSNVDLAPTVLELAGLPVPANMQGRSFAALAAGREGYREREAVFAMFQGKEQRCVRTARHKLIVHFVPYREMVVPVDLSRRETLFHSSPVVQLYDLEADPLEFRNLAEDEAHAALRDELLGRLWDWMESVNDPLLKEPPRTPFYDRAVGLYRRMRPAGD